MFDIRANTIRNYLFIELKGFMSDEDTQKASHLAIIEGKKLKPGFTVINNISEFKPMMQESTKYLIEAQTAVMKMGPSKVIRVVGNSLSKSQFNRVQKEAGVTYEVIETATVEEAMKFI